MPQGRASEYPDVKFEETMIDSIAMKLVIEPQRFDVVVTTNQFGDILTDIGAGLVGGLGLAPGLCVGERQAMAQATHGSAPDISGRNIANPYAMIMSGQMLMAFLGRKHKEPKATAAAGFMQAAIDKSRHRSQAPDPGPGRQRQHPGNGRRHRGGRRAMSRTGNANRQRHVQSSSELRAAGIPRHGAGLRHDEVKPVTLKAERLDLGDRSLLMVLLKASQMGLRTLALPEELGGVGADALTCCIVTEELAAGDADVAAVLSETSALAHLLFAAMTPRSASVLAGLQGATTITWRWRVASPATTRRSA